MLQNIAEILNFQRRSLQKLQVMGNANKWIWIFCVKSYIFIRFLSSARTMEVEIIFQANFGST